MKYLLAGIVLIGGLVLFIAIVVLLMFVAEKIKEVEWKFERKHKKYHYFKEHILPWIIMITFFGAFIFCLIMVYFCILVKL